MADDKKNKLADRVTRKVLALLSTKGQGLKPKDVGPSKYYDEDYLRLSAGMGRHREEVGGAWEDLGKMQLDFLLANGLKPESIMLDIGCGCLRAGIHFIGFLNVGNYYGMDISQTLLDTGYNMELAAVGLQDKLPRTNLVCDGSFSFDRFGTTFDFAIAQSVFTHLSLNHIRVCLTKLAPHMRVGGTLFATFFECPSSQPIVEPIVQQPGGRITYPDKDLYHYYFSDLEHCCRHLPWRVENVGEWNHPRGQKMAAFHRIP